MIMKVIHAGLHQENHTVRMGIKVSSNPTR